MSSDLLPMLDHGNVLTDRVMSDNEEEKKSRISLNSVYALDA